jgi:hypothetical protein
MIKINKMEQIENIYDLPELIPYRKGDKWGFVIEIKKL